MPFLAAATRSTTICSAGADSSSPSSTSATPSTCSSRLARAWAADCKSSISSPNTCRDTPLPVIMLIMLLMTPLAVTSQGRSAHRAVISLAASEPKVPSGMVM